MNSRAKTTRPEAKKQRGARSSDVSLWQQMLAWRAHHASSFSGSLRRLLATPVQTFLTWIVIAIALVLPTALYVALQSVQQLGQGWQDNAQMSAFIEKGARKNAVDALVIRLNKEASIETIDYISPEQALAEFSALSGLGDVVNNLDENPLPSLLIIQPNESVKTPEALDALAAQLNAEPLIEKVQLDLGWLRRLHELLKLGERIVMALAVVLLLGVLLIIGNTLKLAIENRREEIVVVKMVGGTDGFVRRPFLYSGLWYGFGGGIIAIIILQLLGIWLANPLENLSSLYQSKYAVSGYGGLLALTLVGLSTFLGWLSAWLAVRKHLNEIQPS